MCGRYVLTWDDIVYLCELLGIPMPPQLPSRYNIAPTQPVFGIREDEYGELQPTLFQWGLIPHWSKDPSIGSKMINARSETVAEKPSFRTPIRRRRCLIPASGWYEWARTGGGKQPHYIHREDGRPVVFGGIWDVWSQGEDAIIESCSILTTDARADVASLHHRMPVILEQDDWDLWLDRTIQRPEELTPLFHPFRPKTLTAHAVSTRVNKPVNDDPSVIEPDTNMTADAPDEDDEPTLF
ncbi:MAG: SOS response-associated peptidase [Candidatus Poribacteria bacterium]|nr:SOS response-associated peptidase [Candidatus Poribacteria bacterium]